MPDRPAQRTDTGHSITRDSSSTGLAGDRYTTTRRYTTTYAFDSDHGEPPPEPVSLVTEAVAALQGECVDIEFLGATQEIGPKGRTRELTVRYSARTKGTIGRLNCRAGLPASGPPQRQHTAETRRVARTRTASEALIG